jgi:VanZ family protein
MPTLLKRLLLYWTPLLAYLGMIFALSSMSSLPINPPFENFDKLAHFGEYCLLAILLTRALGSLSWPSRSWPILALTMIAILSLGLLDEFYQSTVPGRSSDVLDAAADVMGGLFGCAVYLLARRFWHGRIEAKQ